MDRSKEYESFFVKYLTDNKGNSLLNLLWHFMNSYQQF